MRTTEANEQINANEKCIRFAQLIESSIGGEKSLVYVDARAFSTYSCYCHAVYLTLDIKDE